MKGWYVRSCVILFEKIKKFLAASSAAANPHPARLRHVAESAALHHRGVIYAHNFQVSFCWKSLPGRRCRSGFLNSYVTCVQQMKTRRDVSKWPNFFDKSQQDEQTDPWLRARARACFDIVLLHLRLQ